MTQNTVAQQRVKSRAERLYKSKEAYIGFILEYAWLIDGSDAEKALVIQYGTQQQKDAYAYIQMERLLQ